MLSYDTVPHFTSISRHPSPWSLIGGPSAFFSTKMLLIFLLLLLLLSFFTQEGCLHFQFLFFLKDEMEDGWRTLLFQVCSLFFRFWPPLRTSRPLATSPNRRHRP